MQFKIYGGEADCKKAVDCMVDRLLTQEDERNNNYDRIRPKTKSTVGGVLGTLLLTGININSSLPG